MDVFSFSVRVLAFLWWVYWFFVWLIGWICFVSLLCWCMFYVVLLCAFSNFVCARAASFERISNSLLGLCARFVGAVPFRLGCLGLWLVGSFVNRSGRVGPSVVCPLVPCLVLVGPYGIVIRECGPYGIVIRVCGRLVSCWIGSFGSSFVSLLFSWHSGVWSCLKQNLRPGCLH